jgi:hypothetical protein
MIRRLERGILGAKTLILSAKLQSVDGVLKPPSAAGGANPLATVVEVAGTVVVVGAGVVGVDSTPL